VIKKKHHGLKEQLKQSENSAFQIPLIFVEIERKALCSTTAREILKSSFQLGTNNS
jgi:hypothetical protein